MRRNRESGDDGDNGFSAWGGYMEAKKSKLREQYKETAAKEVEKLSDIFQGIAIFVNGLTNPNANELKVIMAQHGGTFHLYQHSTTTHVIASNLPNVKINKLGAVPIVKPSWISDSLTLGKLLDYRRYLLYTNQSTTQPKLEFPIVAKPTKTASDPNFLEEFYNNSRLHLIATLGADYKQLISDWRDESNRDFPGRHKLSLLQPGSQPSRNKIPTIMHIDMDCFFVSVGLRHRPDLRGLPVAVTHARNAQINARNETVSMNLDRLPQAMEMIDGKSSMSEVASCSYEARRCGVKNGMFLGAAAKLCPNIKTIPYDFEGYKEVSMTLYETIASYTLNIEAVSCDEMYVDVTDILHQYNLTVEQWAGHIRNEIKTVTGCPCSTGFGSNRLQARLATKKAKPDNYYYLKPANVLEYMADMSLADLPGVGRATLSKLKNLDLVTCGDVQNATLPLLQKELGTKIGETLYEQVQGIDRKPLNYHHERKSVSAEINYGIRFKTVVECHNFLENLAKEVWSRLCDVKMRAKCVTLKVMVRAAHAPVETAKYLGHGICDSLSKSVTTNQPISDAATIYKMAKNLYEKMNVDFAELRGIGLQLTKLEKLTAINSTLSKFLQLKSNKSESHPPPLPPPSLVQYPPKMKKNEINNFFKSQKQSQVAQKKEQIDLEVVRQLPPEIQAEIIQEYQLILPKVTKEEKKVGYTAQSPFWGLQWHQLKPILYEWMKSTNEPNQIDLEMLGKYFQQLAIERKIEMLQVAFNFLYRNFMTLGCKWHQGYQLIVNLTQQGMVARYCSTLRVPRDFTCCWQH